MDPFECGMMKVFNKACVRQYSLISDGQADLSRFIIQGISNDCNATSSRLYEGMTIHYRLMAKKEYEAANFAI